MYSVIKLSSPINFIPKYIIIYIYKRYRKPKGTSEWPIQRHRKHLAQRKKRNKTKSQQRKLRKSKTDPTKNRRRARRSFFLLDTRRVNHIVRSHENLVGNRKKRKKGFVHHDLLFLQVVCCSPAVVLVIRHAKYFLCNFGGFFRQYPVKQEAWRVLEMRVFVEIPYIDLNCCFIFLYHQRTYINPAAFNI